MRLVWLLIIGLWGGSWLWSQSPTRVDLALRLIEMETCWEQHRHSQSARLRACEPLAEGITAFFSGRLDLLARQLTLTCWSLHTADASSEAVLEIGSIGVRVPPVLEAETLTQSKAIPIKIFSYYEAPRAQQNLSLKWRLTTRDGKTLMQGELTQSATELSLSDTLQEGDYFLHFTIGNTPYKREWRTAIAVISQLKERLAHMEQALTQHPDAPPITRATAKMALEVLRDAVSGVAPESVYPLRRLLENAEQMLKQSTGNQGGWNPTAGDYWMSAPTERGAIYFRLFLPEGYTRERPIPLVVALHGAGGNEHLFFEGYGLGHILKEAQKRGWAVVAPRSSVNLNHLWGTVEAVKSLIAVDSQRIFLMGHSMGGAQAFSAIAEKPEMFRAVAMLAGAGQPSRFPESLPIFMAVGEQEIGFLKANIERAYQSLKAKNLTHLELRRYNGCEHLMIVREALPDAFAFFDRFANRM